MKGILRFLITIGLVVGIFFGVKALINNQHSIDYVFNNLEWKVNYSADSLKSDLSKLYSYMDSNGSRFSTGGDLESLKQSIETNGEYYNIDLLYQKSQALFNTYKNQSALVKRVSKGTQNDVMDNYKAFVSKIEAQKTASDALGNFIEKITNPNANDFQFYFNQVKNAYKGSLKALAKLNESLRTYILTDVYDNNLQGFEKIKANLITEMIFDYCENNALQADMNKLFEKLDGLTSSEQMQFVTLYARIDNVSSLLKAENKSGYIANGSENLKNIAKMLFDVEPATVEVE